jgi:hypothetical protein
MSMAKRFTSTNKWDKEWFMHLPCKLKCLWQYINDKCDQAGMWEANYTLASLHIGETITESDLAAFGARVEKFAPGKIWVVDHVDFQSGSLSEKSPAHKPIFKLLKKYNLLDRVLNRVSDTLQEKEIEKEKELEEERKRVQGETNYITVEDVRVYDAMICLEQYNAALNGRQAEHKTRNWRDVVPEWFSQNIQVDFKDAKHVFNSFSRYLISPPGKPSRASTSYVHKPSYADITQ